MFGRSFRLPSRLLVFCAFTVLLVAGLHTRARSVQEHQPVIIDIVSPVVPGASVSCDIALTGAPANVTVYSDPPGVVSYQGTVAAANTTIAVPVAPDAPEGTVTLYLVTDGVSVVSDTADCQEIDRSGVP